MRDNPVSPPSSQLNPLHTKKRSFFWLVALVAIAALGLDLLTKAWALANLEEGVAQPFLGNFIQLQLIHNPGAAFSLGAGSTWIFTILSIGIIGLILWYATRVYSPILAVLLGLLAGGAAGNLWDRLTRPPGIGQGHVVDFINYNGWFIGNVADIWIVGAALVLIVWKLFEKDSDEEKDASLEAAGGRSE